MQFYTYRIFKSNLSVGTDTKKSYKVLISFDFYHKWELQPRVKYTFNKWRIKMKWMFKWAFHDYLTCTHSNRKTLYMYMISQYGHSTDPFTWHNTMTSIYDTFVNRFSLGSDFSFQNHINIAQGDPFLW